MQRTEATRVLIIGVNGAMGQHLAQVFTEAPDFQVAAGIDLFPSARENAFPVYENPTDCKEEIDLLIDFSKPELWMPTSTMPAAISCLSSLPQPAILTLRNS